MNGATGAVGGFYMNGNLRAHPPSPFQQPEEGRPGQGQLQAQLSGGQSAMQGTASGQMARQAGNQGQYSGSAESLMALQLLQAQALQQQQQQQAREDQGARNQLHAKLLQQHFQQQQQQEVTSPHALQRHEYQQQLLAAQQQAQRQASLAAQRQDAASPHSGLSQDQQQQLAALQQRHSSHSSQASQQQQQQQQPASPHELGSQQLHASHSQDRQPPSPHALEAHQQQQLQEQRNLYKDQSPRQQQPQNPNSLQQLLQQHAALLDQQQQQQQQTAERRQSTHSEAGQHILGDFGDFADGGGTPCSGSESLSSQQAGSLLRGSMSSGSAHGHADESGQEGPPKGAKTAGGSQRLARALVVAGGMWPLQLILLQVARLAAGRRAWQRAMWSAWQFSAQTLPACNVSQSGARGHGAEISDHVCTPAALVQGVLQELARTGAQRRHAAKVMLDSLLNAVASIHAPDEEDAQLQQAYQTAVQVGRQQQCQLHRAADIGTQVLVQLCLV